MLNEIFSREIPFGGLDVGDVKSKVGRGPFLFLFFFFFSVCFFFFFFFPIVD